MPLTSKEKDAVKRGEEITVENRLDPRQKLAWNYYNDRNSGTFSNGYRSALKAGYAPSYANVITEKDWWITKTRRMSLLTKAEKVMNKTLELAAVDDDGRPKADVLRVQNDIAKHISKTLGKDEGYSEKTEIVGGNPVVFLPQELINKFGLGKNPE